MTTMSDQGTGIHLQSQNLGFGNSFISRKHEDFNALLNEYNPYFYCIFVPAENRERDLKEFSYALVSVEPGKKPHIFRWLRDVDLNDPVPILTWVWEGDMSKHRPIDVLQRLDAEEKFKQLVKMRAEAELKEEMTDLTVNIIKGGRDRKHYYKHDGVVYR